MFAELSQNNRLLRLHFSEDALVATKVPQHVRRGEMMALYSVVLFVHLLAALALACSLSFEALSVVRLRRSTSLDEVGLWMNLVPGLPAMAMGSWLVLLLSGGYMTSKMSGWTFVWPKAAILAMVLIAPLGAVTGRRMRMIRRELASGASTESELLSALRNPIFKFSLYVRAWVIAGIVLLMAEKPGMVESAAIIAVSVIAGLLFAVFGSRGSRNVVVTGTITGRHTAIDR